MPVQPDADRIMLGADLSGPVGGANLENSKEGRNSVATTAREKLLLTPELAAELLSLSRVTVYELICRCRGCDEKHEDYCPRLPEVPA